MRIYRMTATFGKLDHETLTLEPGLNIIQAPNEWGKSTWCAFLAAMLYGLDTRAKSTKTALADKERYLPWSGSPMAGRMDLCWNGRDITIERMTKGRIPLGVFRAYETATGLPVPELTTANCGQQLLGVEQSVFRRSGFVRLSDLPVTADENLRRRLNALVTTGDESGDADRLSKELRDLRNRCRYNRTGLIPQAEAEAAALEESLRELETLEAHSAKLKQRLGETKAWLRQLQNHRAALAWTEAEADSARVAQARDAHAGVLARLEEMESAMANLPDRETARQKLRDLAEFQENRERARQDQQHLPAAPEKPQMPEPFFDLSLSQAEDMAGEDIRRYELLRRTKPYLVFQLMSGAFLVLSAIAAVTRDLALAGLLAALGIGCLIPGLVIRKKWKAEAAALARKYGTPDPDRWTAPLESYRAELRAYELSLVEQSVARGDLDAWLEALEKQRQSLCGSQSPEQVRQVWTEVLSQWDRYFETRRQVRQQEQHLAALAAMAKTAPKPEFPDTLTATEAETDRLLADARQEQQRLQNRLGQYQGRMEALGDPARLQQKLDRVHARLEKLQNTYDALTLALETLADARLELQRRFAPRITARAQELMALMTHGRYQRLTLGEDFSLLAGAEQEDVLQNALWRSDGTLDQLYLALRLAVAEALTPEAPLILDDALVRFDDTRLKAALDILKAQAETRQILLFTCQSREQQAMM